LVNTFALETSYNMHHVYHDPKSSADPGPGQLSYKDVSSKARKGIFFQYNVMQLDKFCWRKSKWYISSTVHNQYKYVQCQ